ncbi:hypothetical protein Cgig2_004340 [Carnegiea gigantea]|uniref:Uncharacterized protein n=1 Tax=Carnegiea gigantea TaxID=171969 RepID=A0A9Q1GIR7_9CARY|nr:hypothetical protein Cgig2_004340 [Carnegiea gigantea]
MEVTNHNPSTYASLIDPKEGTNLKFIPMKEVNGRKGAKIKKADVDYWENAILCGVMGSNPPFVVIDGFVHCIWKSMEIDKVIMVRKGVFLVRFTNMHYKLTSLSKLGSMFGMPIKTNRVTKEKIALQYARMLIEMKINEPFLDHIDFINDWDVVVRQDVKYEWQPIKCAHY